VTTDHRRIGDRWLAGETLPGIGFARHDSVLVAEGRYQGRVGTISLLLTPPPDPLYLVELRGEPAADVRVRQSALQRVM
jgi:hypothetical protein